MKAYQLKITIKNSHPPIWRRVIVPAGLSFSQLSVVINEVMDWSGAHLFSFEFFKQNLRIEETDEDFGFGYMNVEEASETLIDTYLDREERFAYVYDFGDDWRHTVTVEKIIEEYDKDYPVVLKYKGETPIEDCGGIWGFYDKQRILENPDDPEYEDIREWAGVSLTDFFELENMNGRLEAFFLGKKKSKPMRQREIYKDLLDSGTGFKRIQGTNSYSRNKNPGEFREYNGYDGEDEIEKLFGTRLKDLKRQLENMLEQQRMALENVTLRDIYQDYTKDNLIEMAKNHHLGGYSRFKKDELIDFLVYQVLDKEVMCQYLTFLDDDELEIIEKFSDPANYGKATEEDMFSAMALFVGGYAGSGGINDIIVPKEVLQAYKENCDKEWRRLRREALELSYYLNAAAELYGICPMEKALDIYRKHTGKEIDEIKMYGFCLNIPENKKAFVYNGVRMVHKSLLEEEDMDELLKIQSGKPYYMPTKKEALTLGKEGYLPFDDSLKALESFLNVFFGEISGYAQDICRYIQERIRAGADIEEIMEFMEDNDIFEEIYDREAIEAFKQLLLKVWHRTRKMSNRGNLPKGMTRQEIAGSRLAVESQGKADVLKFPIDINKKIYPNDPCPCGSGKKYKKCCGKK